jgi:hypothetical protein
MCRGGSKRRSGSIGARCWRWSCPSVWLSGRPEWEGLLFALILPVSADGQGEGRLAARIGVLPWFTRSTLTRVRSGSRCFVVGFLLRPRHVWFVWLCAVVVQWIAMGCARPHRRENAHRHPCECFGWGGLPAMCWMEAVTRGHASAGSA